MSSTVETSLVTMLNKSIIPQVSSYLQKSYQKTPAAAYKRSHQNKNTMASTIYHSPQSSPNESLRTSPSMTMFDEDNTNNNNNNDNDDEKPLDFSAKSSDHSTANTNNIQQRQLQQPNRESPKLHKKVHPKFLASKVQHQDHETEHCFSTPSPSPPEHSTTTDLSTGKNLNGFRYNETNQLLDKTDTTKQIMFEKFLKELNHPTSTNDDECSANLNETFLLNQALQLAKLNCVVPGPMVMDSSSRIPDHQQTAAAQLLNLITQAHNPQIPSNMELFKNYQTTMKSPESPIKPLSSPPNSLSPSMNLTNGHQSAVPNSQQKSSLPGLNGGVILPTALNSNIEKATSLLDNGQNKTAAHQHNLRSSTSSKYTRPFKAYNNKDFSLLQPSTMPFSIESLASQSLLNSNPAYHQFRSQMLSNKTNTRSNRRSSSSIYANGNNSVKSELFDDNSSNSSYNGTIENLNSQSMLAINDIHSNQPALNSTTSITPPNSSRKRGRPLPDDLKDDAYWERRRKNNEAAKRSRDLRRAKEDEIAIRACFLEKENQELKYELLQLKLEIDKMKTLLNVHNHHSATTANSQHQKSSNNKGQS